MTALNVHQRLAGVMRDVTYIQKEKKPGMNYTIVSHDTVTAKVRPALLAHGIVYYPVRCQHSHNGNRAECSMTVRFVNIDQPDDYFDVESFGYGIDAQDKGPGKAMSYAVKYALLKACGLETGDDPDTESIDHSDRDPATPQFDAAACLSRLMAGIEKRHTKQDLRDFWKQEADAMGSLRKAAPQMFDRFKAAFAAAGERATDDPARQSPPIEEEAA